MQIYLYLSMLPEALIASMLPPREFGTYFAVGAKERSRGQAIFFKVERGFQSNYFPLSEIERRCVPHPDGQPKHSVYLSVYRVLEHVPLDAIKNLYLTTRDGRVLELERGKEIPEVSRRFHLYQEICPVHPRIASTLGPKEFCRLMTDGSRPIHVPKICFVELRLGELADNPERGSVHDLPYPAIEHLRDCLILLRDQAEKNTKTVDRIPQEFPYRTVENGFFLGEGENLLYFPFPSQEDFQTKYYDWWRSATL
ncbi:MAG: hypothetical protein ACUVXI_10660 [bacterium]